MQTDTPHLHVRKNHGINHIFRPSRINKRLYSLPAVTCYSRFNYRRIATQLLQLPLPLKATGYIKFA
jgi:hypothetical protein